MLTKSESCATVYRKLSEIRALQAAFDSVLSEALVSGEFSSLESLSTDLERKLSALEVVMSRLEVTEKLEVAFDLTEQYDSQVDILRNNGLLERFTNGLEGIRDTKGIEYPVPTLQEVQARFEVNPDFFLRKREQGFGQLRLVPFALPIATIVEKVGAAIIRHYDPDPTKTRLFSAIKDPTKQSVPAEYNPDSSEPMPLVLSTTKPPVSILNGWSMEDKVVYYPQQFDEKNHGGKTKAELLAEDSSNGWNILLLEDSLNIPRAATSQKEGNGQTIGDRPQIEAGKNAEDYLTDLQAAQADPSSVYLGEAATTIEDWLMHFLTVLKKTNQVIDDHSGNGSGAWQLGIYSLPVDRQSFGKVGDCFWDHPNKQAFVEGSDPRGSNPDQGVRFGVRI